MFTLSDFIPCLMQKLDMLTVARDKNIGSVKSDFDIICKHDSETMHCV